MDGTASVAIIPARYSSSRLPGKPLIEVAGRPLIEHVYRRVELARGLSRILVATDDERVVRAVEAFGGSAVLTRSDHATGTDRLTEAAAGLPGDALVVNVQGDEPLIEPEAIEAALESARSGDADVVTLMSELNDPELLEDPNQVKVVVDRRGFAMYFSRSRIPSGGRAYLHLGLYVYSAGFLRGFQALEPTPLERAERLEQLRILENGFRIRVVQVPAAFRGIDTPDDLEAFRKRLETGEPERLRHG